MFEMDMLFLVMRYLLLFLFVIAMGLTSADAQEKWDLKKCVEYAMANNISVRQTALQEKTTELTYRQSKQSQYPNASFSSNTAFNSGRNQDPTSFSLITQSYLSAAFQLQTSADIFNWYSRKNAILANKWEVEAAKAATDKLKNDIALTVANNYLQVLLTMEQEKIAAVQVDQTRSQWQNTRKLVDAGSLPELNAAELEAQFARDSASYISAKGNVTQALLALKSQMNLDPAAPFDVAVPPVDIIPVEKIADLQPEYVIALALKNLPQQRVNDFKLKAAQKNALSARGAMYPTLGGFGSLGTGFNSQARELTGFTLNNDPVGKVTIGGSTYDVFSNQPGINATYGKTPFFHQLDQNFRQSIGLSLSVPIFNGASLRTNWERSKWSVKNVELQKEADNQKIKQDIYQAYNAALVALEKYEASVKSVQAAERTLDYASKRYAVGMLGTFELITNQNNLFRAKLDKALNQFDYVFKMKVLEFYKGEGLKL